MAIPLLTLAIPQAEAATKPPGVVYYNNPWCGSLGIAPCPVTYMKNRYNTKILAIYAPNGTNYCNTGSMSVWIMGHPNNAQGVGFTTSDWQDLEIAKQKTGGYYRWGCCYSSDTYNTICLN
jgi:hypothetical protein